MNFVTIDFETSTYKQDSACSVGLVKFIDGKETDTFYSLVKPPRLYIRPDFTKIHGLTVDDVRDAPGFYEIWESNIKTFIDGFPLAAHNASFDMGVLKAVLTRYELDVPELQYFCTCNLSRRTWPQLKSHALTALAGHFNIIYEAHNALDDALTCGKLVLMSAQKYGSKDLAHLLYAARIEMKTLYAELSI